MILETRFTTPGGEAALLDFFALDETGERPCYDFIRVVDGIRGEVELDIDVAPRFDYGEITPHMRRHRNGRIVATGSNKGLVMQSSAPLDLVEKHRLHGRVRLHAGQRIHLVIRFEFPVHVKQTAESPMPDGKEIDARLEYTRQWWERWSARAEPSMLQDEQTMRSIIILKSLTFEPTGAVVAASTTSLPEAMGGSRNWDYRYSWIRDSVFVVDALQQLGYAAEARRFHEFIERSSAGSAEQLQIMYAVDGKRRLSEIELKWMEGYRGSAPVRIGNRAAKQRQIDIYGELLQLAWRGHASGHSMDKEYWDFLRSVVETVCADWDQPDHGIWEMRDAPRHFVHSKAMCWAAVDHGSKLARQIGAEAPPRWHEARDRIRQAIETSGYDPKRGIFVQAFGSGALDASLLLLPRTGLVDWNDPRMVRTVEAICKELDRGGLLLRYDAPDGLPEQEGMFLPCTFWLAAGLAHQGRREEALRYYRRAASCANELGLFSEEFDPVRQDMLGNFPQALTHVSQIIARMALQRSA